MEIQKLVDSIKSQQRQIQENQEERNLKYRSNMESFRSHLEQEITNVEQGIVASQKRNRSFTDQYEITYDRVLIGAEEIIRKMKQTYFNKKELCRKIIEDHVETAQEHKDLLNDQLIQNENKYNQAIDVEKLSKINFSKFLEDKEINRRLLEQENKNKVMEERMTMYNTNWGFTLNKTTPPQMQIQPRRDSDIHQPNNVINHFMKHTAPKVSQFPQRVQFSSPSQGAMGNRRASVHQHHNGY